MLKAKAIRTFNSEREDEETSTVSSYEEFHLQS
jgi:hypothetical protein